MEYLFWRQQQTGYYKDTQKRCLPSQSIQTYPELKNRSKTYRMRYIWPMAPSGKKRQLWLWAVRQAGWPGLGKKVTVPVTEPWHIPHSSTRPHRAMAGAGGASRLGSERHLERSQCSAILEEVRARKGTGKQLGGRGGQSRSGREAEPKVPEQLRSRWVGGKKEQDTCRLKITVLGRIIGF